MRQNRRRVSSPGQFREAEIENLGQTLRRHHHVGRLQIAVHDSDAVRRRQRIGYLRGDTSGNRPSGFLPRLDQIGQRLAAHELHHDAFGVYRDWRQMSWIVMMFGWFSDEAARASWMNRARRSAFRRPIRRSAP